MTCASDDKFWEFNASIATPITNSDTKSELESQCEAHNCIIHKNAAGDDSDVSWPGCEIFKGWFHSVCVVLANATKEQLQQCNCTCNKCKYFYDVLCAKQNQPSRGYFSK